MVQLDATLALVKQILKDDYLSLTVADYEISEPVIRDGPCRAVVTLRDPRGEMRTIMGEGVGVVDALYHGMLGHYALEFGSLNTIQLSGFTVRGEMDTSRDKKGSDAVSVVTVTVSNSSGHSFDFERSGRSMVAAALAAVVEAIDFFINSERAFISAYHAVCDARERGRGDLVQDFTHQLSQLVATTSYTEVIKRIQDEVL